MLALAAALALAAPAPDWGVELAAGRFGVQQSHLDRESAWVLQGGLSRRIVGPLWAVAALEHWSFSDDAGGLASHQRTVTLLGAGQWRYDGEIFRFDARLGGGPAAERSRLRDEAGFDATATRLRGVVDLSGGAAIQVLPALALGARSGGRWEPGRLHYYITLGAAWALGPSAPSP